MLAFTTPNKVYGVCRINIVCHIWKRMAQGLLCNRSGCYRKNYKIDTFLFLRLLNSENCEKFSKNICFFSKKLRFGASINHQI